MATWDDSHDHEYADAQEAFLHPDAADDGGLAFNDKVLLERQRSAILSLVTQMGKNLMMGKLNIMSVSLPVKMFEPRSYLQKVADVWVYPKLLTEAALATDPIERMRHTVTYFLAGLHLIFATWSKPFNPILGETWQAQLSDGTELFMEQISHHPPISAFQMFGPEGLWYFSGVQQPEISYKGNNLKTCNKGGRRVQFKDGGCIEVYYPAHYLRGLLYTSEPRGEVVGSCQFIDKQNNLVCDIAFGKVNEEGSGDKWLLQRPDALSGCIYTSVDGTASATGTGKPKSLLSKVGVRSMLGGGLLSKGSAPNLVAAFEGPNGEPALSVCRGNWLSHVDWDHTRYWTYTEDAPAMWVEVANVLPSDCMLRVDLNQLKQGDLKASQESKDGLENLQRLDAKLRKEFLGAH